MAKAKTTKVLKLDWVQGKLVSAKIQELPKTGAKLRLQKADNLEPRYVAIDKAELFNVSIVDGEVEILCCNKENICDDGTCCDEPCNDKANDKE